MTVANLPVRGQKTSATGILVLGMHRSGTSALARVLNLCGANIGTRVLGVSAGNETGHWEDAFAVEEHERLLAAFGSRWDDPFALPFDWRKSEAGKNTSQSISSYIHGDRSRHQLWAVKDPRLCLFAESWVEAAKGDGQEISAIILLRHPMEVARSLAVRDAIAPGRGLLLWLEYSLAALRVADQVPTIMVTYEQLLENWEAVIEQVRSLPGAEALAVSKSASSSVNKFLDGGLRHHRAVDDNSMPQAVSETWKFLLENAGIGAVASGVSAKLVEKLGPLRELLHPVLDEWRVTRRQLWERIGHAEASRGESVAIPAELSALREAVQLQHVGLIEAFTSDVRHMQDVAAQALESSAAIAAEAGLSESLALRLDSLTELMEGNGKSQVILISEELRRMQEVTAEAVKSAASVEREAELVRTLAPRLDMLSEELQAGHGGLITSISEELRRMQEVTAEAVKSAASVEREAELVRALSPRMDALSDNLDSQFRVVNDLLGQEMRLLRERALRLETENRSYEVVLREARGEVLELRSLEELSSKKLSDESEARIAAEKEASLRLQESLIVRHELEHLSNLASQLQRLKSSRSWRFTRPLRALARLLTGNWATSDAAKVRAWLRRTATQLPLIGNRNRAKLVGLTLGGGQAGMAVQDLPDQAEAGAIGLAQQSEELPDVFVWAVIDWHFRFQRPQHLARALAEKGHRVFYMSNNFVDHVEPGFHVDSLGCHNRLFQVHLNLSDAPSIYIDMPDATQIDALKSSLGKVLEWTCTRSSVSLVQHPYWSSLAYAVPAARVVYDCMDHHGGFEDNADAVLRAERRLVSSSDLVIVTSSWLEDEISPRARATAMVRNAGEFEFFRDPPERVFSDEQGRKVIGYYGAIAEWFDTELVRAVAEANPDAIVVLVGNDTAFVGSKLANLVNVRMVGEVPYKDLPYWLHGFNVCLLPFRVIPLTLATNPVKVYEYLAAGRPVVSVDLPEMAQFQDLVRTADSLDGFVSAVADVLSNSEVDLEMVAARQAFASGQTWSHRALALDAAIELINEPKVSVIVLTFNNLAFTENCLFSIEAYSSYRNLEVIVVDNASTDGSPEWLQEWQAEGSDAGHTRLLILNQENLGFSAGNNVGLHAATGEILIILNNDTYVTPGWVRDLSNHLLSDDKLGLVGPVTNNIGNEARIDIAYADMAEMIHGASIYTRRQPGRLFPVRNAAFFCVAMRREIYERVGDMDEEFGIGFFEDDDYCRRVEGEGFYVGCAENVFVHHHLSASFDSLKGDFKKELFDRNKVIYEKKWGPWIPHSYRPTTLTN